jgi:hypothetical protein
MDVLSRLAKELYVARRQGDAKSHGWALRRVNFRIAARQSVLEPLDLTVVAEQRT